MGEAVNDPVLISNSVLLVMPGLMGNHSVTWKYIIYCETSIIETGSELMAFNETNDVL